MAEDVTAVNDNTNEPQPSEAAEKPTENADTLLGGTGTDTQKEQQEQPQAPEAYDFKASIPEGVEVDEAITKDFSEMARGMNLTNEQANQVAAFGIKYGQQVAESIIAQRNAQVAEWGETAKKELGADFEKVMSTAGAGIEAVEKLVPGIRQALNETGAGNRIEVIRAFEMFGHKVREDPGQMVNVGGQAPPQKPTTWYPNSKM